MDETPLTKKPRWRRILELEALAAEMDKLGEANRKSAAAASEWLAVPGRAEEGSATQIQTSPPLPPSLPLPGGYQPSNPIEQIAITAAPVVLLVWWFARDTISPFGYVLIGVFACVVALPTIIAFSRGHPQKWAIMVLCMFGGWTGILWIAALAWSLTNPQPVQIIYVNAPPAPTPDPQSSGPTT